MSRYSSVFGIGIDASIPLMAALVVNVGAESRNKGQSALSFADDSENACRRFSRVAVGSMSPQRWMSAGDSSRLGYRAVPITMNRPMKTYAPPLTTNPHDPLYRVDKAIRAAQLRLDAAIDAKRHHTSQNLAHEVIKEAREGLKKAEQARVLKIKEVALKAAESETESKR
ncbi:hypothetical protein [Dyella ginsengisoli]